MIETTSIGAYFATPAVHNLAGRWSRPHRVEALGTVGHCRNICSEADAAADAAIEQGAETVTICMPAGWCHYYDDPYVLIDAIR